MLIWTLTWASIGQRYLKLMAYWESSLCWLWHVQVYLFLCVFRNLVQEPCRVKTDWTFKLLYVWKHLYVSFVFIWLKSEEGKIYFEYLTVMWQLLELVKSLEGQIQRPEIKSCLHLSVEGLWWEEGYLPFCAIYKLKKKVSYFCKKNISCCGVLNINIDTTINGGARKFFSGGVN